VTSVGSIRADVTRRLLIFAALFAVVGTACSVQELPPVDFGQDRRFVPTVADSQDDVGLGSAVAVAEDDTVFVSSMSFPEVLKEGQVASLRPIGAPFLPAVALTSITPDGIFSRGAVEQDKPEFEPNGVEPPFRPAKVPGYDLTRANGNGTDVAIGPDGTIHVVWAGADGIYHATTKVGGSSTVDQVFDYGSSLTVAGPIGRPSVTLDGAGSPWVAFGVSTTDGVDIVVATPGAKGWDTRTVATAASCNGCPPPLPTGITTAGDVPVVVFADPAGTVRSVHLDGKDWVEEPVADGAAAGLAVATDGDTAYASYYREDGKVAVSAYSGGTWTSVDVADAPFPDVTTGLEAPTTDVAAASGKVAVTWQDADAVRLATGDGATFTTEETTGTAGGTRPSVGMSADGNSIALAWVSAENTDLMVGILGDPKDLLVANPSPAPTVSIAPVAPTGCGDDKKIDLEISASGST